MGGSRRVSVADNVLQPQTSDIVSMQTEPNFNNRVNPRSAGPGSDDENESKDEEPELESPYEDENDMFLPDDDDAGNNH